MIAPPPALRVLAGIAVLEGAVLLGYAVFDVVEAVRVGITGPEEVSNPIALVVLVAITAFFGIALMLIGRGWWRAQRWARAPFLLAQIIAALIGYQLLQAEGSVERVVGAIGVVLGVLGIVLSLLPAVSRAVDSDDDNDDGRGDQG